MWTCPFCGQEGNRTDEHVWPQWLRNYDLYAEMNEGYTGQRFKRTERLYRIGESARYQAEENRGKHVASFLPHLQVGVCARCNNQWMSQMEITAERILDPLIHGNSLTLSVLDQEFLATWVTKCSYAYAAEWELVNRPWTIDEYREFTAGPHPSARSTIWLGRSIAPLAYIAQSVVPLFISNAPADQLGQVPPGAASSYIAAHSVVFVAHWWPQALSDEGIEEEVFHSGLNEGLVRIWPPIGPVEWPTKLILERRLVEQTGLFQRIDEESALPVEGRSPDEIEQIAADFYAGSSTEEIRRKWADPDENTMTRDDNLAEGTPPISEQEGAHAEALESQVAETALLGEPPFDAALKIGSTAQQMLRSRISSR